MACDIKRTQEKQAIREILHEQMQMDQLRKKIDREDIQEPTETHFGPEEDRKVALHKVTRKKDMQKLVNSHLMEQMQTNAERNKRKLEKTKLTDAVNMGAVNDQLYNEASENAGKRRKDISDYRGAWKNQVAQTTNKKNVDAIVQGAVF